MFRRKPTEVFLLASTLLAGCGALFGIDDPERPPAGDASGEGGTRGGGTSGGGASGGTNGGGAGGTVEPQGGSGMAGDGGEVATGGSSGKATGGGDGGGGTAGSSDAGGDGGGGDGDGDEFPSKDDPCPTPGALACSGQAQKLRLICERGFWRETHECEDVDSTNQRNCDRRSGACAVVRSECVNETPSNQYAECPEGGTEASSCGPDLVSIVVEHCDLGCNNVTQKCAKASGDELIFDRVPPTQSDFVFWPTPVIPVCFLDEDDEFATLRAAIRDEVESTWGRYSSVAFSGWNDCMDSPGLAEARILLVDNCMGELARIPRYGYPGPGAKLELEICKTYFDANDAAAQVADEVMLGFVARHLFGHVLGREHVPWDFMRPVFHPSMIPELVFGHAAVEELQRVYGGKPSGSLVNAGGRCVGWSPEGPIGIHVCDGSTETRWQALEGRLEAEGGTGCLHASIDGAVSLGPCAPTPDVWETNDVQWRGNGGRCVTRSSPTPGVSLVSEPCRALGDADQSWSFDFYDDRHVRIRGADDQCVHIPEAVDGPPPWPELAPCGGARDGLEVTSNAQLALSGYCMESDALSAYVVRLSPCRATPAQSFYLSGPLGHGAGTVLTLSSEDALNAAPSSEAASQAQIFDYHF